MPPLPPEHRRAMAASLDTAIQSVLEGSYTKEKKLQVLLKKSQQRLEVWNSSTQYYKQVMRLAYEEDNYDDLLEFLEAADAAAPLSEFTHGRDRLSERQRHTIQDQVQQSVVSGLLDPYNTAQPAVESWIARHAKRIRELLMSSPAFLKNDGARLHELLLGTAVALHSLLAGAGEYFRTARESFEREHRFVANCIGDVRLALLHTIIRDFWAATGDTMDEAAKKAFTEGYDRFQSHRFKTYALPGREQFGYVTSFVKKLESNQAAFEEIEWTLLDQSLLPDLASRVARHVGLQQTDIESEWEPAPLPWGQVSLVRTSRTARDIVYYTVNGVLHERSIATSWSDPQITLDEQYSPRVPAGEEGFSALGVARCRIDDAGKVYITDLDRLAPPPADESYLQTAKLLRAADRHFDQELRKRQRVHGKLFQRVHEFGPYIFLQTPEGEDLLCRSDAVEALCPLLRREPSDTDRTEALLQHAQISVPTPWASFSLSQIPQTPDDSRANWRRRIREKLKRERIPSLDWITRRLAPFDVTATTKGRGSHGSLVLERGGGTRRQNTWHALRGTESLSYGILWEFLEQLGIGEEEFYRGLSERD